MLRLLARVPSQEVEDEDHSPHTTARPELSPGSERSREVCRPYSADNGHSKAVAAAGRSQACADLVALYEELRRAPTGSEDFELLMAAFNRACADDPKAVLRALQMEAFTA